MSYTRINRPGAIRTSQGINQQGVRRMDMNAQRGLGYGQGTGRGASYNTGGSGPLSNRTGSLAESDDMMAGLEREQKIDVNDGERRMEHRGSYSVMAPNQKKRAEISQLAERETRDYEAYKDANRLTYVNYVGTVGGGPVGNASGVSRLVSQQPGRYQKLEQRQRYRQEAKAREDEEYRIKKEKARQQTERNAQRKQMEDQQRKTAFGEQHRRTNQAFLDRLEGK